MNQAALLPELVRAVPTGRGRPSSVALPSVWPRELVALAHVALTTVSVAFVLMLWNGGVDSHEVMDVATLLAVVLFAWSAWSWRAIGGEFFGPYFLTLGAGYLFHIGQYILGALGVADELYGGPFYLFRFSQDTLLRTLVLILVGLGGFHLGALLAWRGPVGDSLAHALPARDDLLNCRIVGWFLIAISAGPALAILSDQVQIRMAGGYHEIWMQDQEVGLANWKNVVAAALTPGILFLLAGSKGRPGCIAVTALGLAAQFVGLLVVGDRSGAIMPLIGYGWVYHLSIRPLPRALFHWAAAGLFLLIPLVAQVRHTPVDQLLSPAALADAISSQENPVVAILYETGITAAFVCDTLELVPSSRPFGLGLGYLHAVLGNINFLVPVDLTGGFGEPHVWLVQARYPERLARNQFLGFSFLAEAYMEFGWLGAPVALAGFGAFFVRLTTWARRRFNPARIAMVGAFMFILPHFTRGHSLELGRPFVRYSLLPYLLVLVLGVFRKGHLPDGSRS